MGSLALHYCTYSHVFYGITNPTCSFAISTTRTSEEESWEQINEPLPPSPFTPSPVDTAHEAASHAASHRAH